MTNCFGKEFDKTRECELCQVRMSCYKKYSSRTKQLGLEGFKRPEMIYKSMIKKDGWLCDKKN